MKSIMSKEVDYVRELATQVLQIATSDKNKKVINRWKDVNELRKADRAPVWCNPVGAWDEIIPSNSLVCTDPILRELELKFKKTIIKNQIDDDTPVLDYYKLDVVYDVEPENIWGIEPEFIMPTEATGAYTYNPPLKDESDYDKLKIPKFTYNETKTTEDYNKYNELIGDILPIKLNGYLPLHSILCKYAAEFRGLTEIMMDMAINPKLVHTLMTHFRDGVLAAIKQVEEMNILSPNNDEPMYFSDFFGPKHENGSLTCKNLWCATNSQEVDQVSPQMWEEFLLDYQKPILEKFGRVSYGCCENLTHKIDGVLSIPNLRVFVCSAWTDLDKVIDKVGDKYTIMWRQKATDVVFTDDISTIKHHLEEGMRKLQGCHYQVVLRELQTINNNPDRLHVWAEIAKEASAKFA